MEINNNSICGIGHTRWATHGSVNLKNTHPIYTELKGIAYNDKIVASENYIVHNGIIENSKAIFDFCKYTPLTETDTEAISCLLNMNLFLCNTFSGALIETCKKLRGQYAFAVITPQYPNQIGFACDGSPLVFSSNGFLSSDINAISDYIDNNNYYLVPDKTIGVFETKDLEPVLYNFDYSNIQALKRQFVPSKEKPNTKHSFAMLNEIEEQISYVQNYKTSKEIKGINKTTKEVCLFGCGSSYNAALLGRKYLKSIPQIEASVEYATELAEEERGWKKKALYLGLTQSGETKDTLSALEQSSDFVENGQVGVLHNNPNSRAAQLSLDYSINIDCGPEFGVAATKTFTAQCLKLLEISYKLKYGLYTNLFKNDISLLSSFLNEVINGKIREKINKTTKYIDEFHNILYLGRGLLYPIAKEGALKMKEVAYKHAEAIHVSELKHGALALIDENTLPIVLISNPDKLLSAKVVSNIKEIIARSKEILVICDEKTKEMIPKEIDEDKVICLPYLSLYLQPIIFNVALQLFAYNVGVFNGINVDKPKSISKVVTV